MTKQFWAILIGASIGLIALFMVTGDSSDNNTSNNGNTNTDEPLALVATDHVYSAGTKEVTLDADGKAVVTDDQSKVTLIEYGDLECPACAQTFPLVQQAKEEFGSDLQFVFRHFPLASIHPNATAAHRAAEAAGNQGKFFEMHDLMYERAQLWTRQQAGLDVSAAYTVFESFARELELDVERYKADIESEAVFNVIDASSDVGSSLDVTSTPTFFMDGEQLEPIGSYDQLRGLIQEKIDAHDADTTEVPAEETVTDDKAEAAEVTN